MADAGTAGTPAQPRKYAKHEYVLVTNVAEDQLSQTFASHPDLEGLRSKNTYSVKTGVRESYVCKDLARHLPGAKCPISVRVIHKGDGTVDIRRAGKHEHTAAMLAKTKNGLYAYPQARLHVEKMLATNPHIKPKALFFEVKRVFESSPWWIAAAGEYATKEPQECFEDTLRKIINNYKKNRKQRAKDKTGGVGRNPRVVFIRAEVQKWQPKPGRRPQDPYVLEIAERAIWEDSDGRLHTCITITCDTWLKRMGHEHLTCLGVDTTFCTNTESINKKMFGYETFMKTFKPLAMSIGDKDTTIAYKHALQHCEAFAMQNLGRPHLFTNLTNLQRDGDIAIRNCYRELAKDRGITLIEAGAVASPTGDNVAAEDFDAAKGHGRCYREAIGGRLVLHGTCSVHNDRKIHACKLGWMTFKDGEITHRITSANAKEMKHMLQSMDNLDSCDAFNIAVELFRAHWNPMYPHQMTAFMATPYALGAHSKWFTGMFNHQNTLEKNNDVHKQEIMYSGALNIVQDIDMSCRSISTFGTGKTKMHIATNPLDCTAHTMTDFTVRRLKRQFESAQEFRGVMDRIKARDASILGLLELPSIPVDADHVNGVLAAILRKIHVELASIREELTLAEQITHRALQAKAYTELKQHGARVTELDMKQTALQTNIAELTASCSSIATRPLSCFAIPNEMIRKMLAQGKLPIAALTTWFEEWKARGDPSQLSQVAEQGNHQTIDAFLVKCHRFYTITEKPIKSTTTINFTCTCPEGFKYQVCKHTIHFSQQTTPKLVNPDEFSEETLLAKQPVGRGRSDSPPKMSLERKRARIELDEATSMAMSVPTPPSPTGSMASSSSGLNGANDAWVGHPARCGACSFHDPTPGWVVPMVCAICHCGLCERCGRDGLDEQGEHSTCLPCIDATADRARSSGPPPPPPPPMSAAAVAVEDRGITAKFAHAFEEDTNIGKPNPGYYQSDQSRRGAGNAWELTGRNPTTEDAL